MTAFSTLTAAFIAALETAPAVCATVYRSRDRQIPEEITEAINVQWAGARPALQAIKDQPVDWESNFCIDCYARSSTESGDVAVDDLLAAAYARIRSSASLAAAITAAGGCLGEPSMEPEDAADAQKTGWVRMTFPVQHRTSNLTLD